MSNDSDIATPYTYMKHLIAARQAKRKQARFVSIEETEYSIMFISIPSPIRGSGSNHNSPLQIHLYGEATEDTMDADSHIESISLRVNV